MARESMPSAWIRSSSSGIRLAPSRREYSLCVWRWTNDTPIKIPALPRIVKSAWPRILRGHVVGGARLHAGLDGPVSAAHARGAARGARDLGARFLAARGPPGRRARE